MHSGQQGAETGRDNSLNTTSLSNRKGWLINFGTLVFVFMVGRIIGIQTSEDSGGGGEGRTRGRGMGRWLDSERAPERKGKGVKSSPLLLRSWAASWDGELKSSAKTEKSTAARRDYLEQ